METKYTIEQAVTHLEKGGVIKYDVAFSDFLNEILRKVGSIYNWNFNKENYYGYSIDYGLLKYTNKTELYVIKLSQITSTPTEPEATNFPCYTQSMDGAKCEKQCLDCSQDLKGSQPLSVLKRLETLHPDSLELLNHCRSILACKMVANQEKYGYTNEWLTQDWENECKEHLLKHLYKGDPKDVAIYAMFMIFRGWSTAPIEPAGTSKLLSEAMDWIYVKDRAPIAYQTGDWDGKKSDEVIAVDSDGTKYLAHIYEGFMDGSCFLEWYSDSNYMIENVVKWLPIPL